MRCRNAAKDQRHQGSTSEPTEAKAAGRVLRPWQTAFIVRLNSGKSELIASNERHDYPYNHCTL